jgi:hypothetical protein
MVTARQTQDLLTPGNSTSYQLRVESAADLPDECDYSVTMGKNQQCGTGLGGWTCGISVRPNVDDSTACAHRSVNVVHSLSVCISHVNLLQHKVVCRELLLRSGSGLMSQYRR